MSGDASNVRSSMTDFWKQYSDLSTVNGMMLDSHAEDLDKVERPEILSYLPQLSGKRVIELGAGIGRFTGGFAAKAKHVVAVDFMAEYLQKNQQTNEHFGNIEFVCADVTQFSREKESADLVFTNWLLMYLGDSEVPELLTNILTWLVPGGYVFLRENCGSNVGDLVSGLNPTVYRDRLQYDKCLSSLTIPADGNKVYGFDVVLCRGVEAYIKMKRRSNQFVWLVQKVERDPVSTRGFQTFQQYLDTQQYPADRILCNEKVFGRTFLSPGGPETTKEFVSLLKLQQGQRVLDVGGGIGGSAFYMAKEYGAHVLCMDLSLNAFRIGKERAQQLRIGSDQVTFEIADATKRDYAPESFDVIYSRDAILHMEDKLPLFQKFFTWLRPGGKLLITDHCCGEGPPSDSFKAYVRDRCYHLLTVDAYGKLLQEAGFVKVKAEDRTKQFLQVLQRELTATEAIREEFIKEFSEEGYSHVTDYWKTKIVMVEEGRQKWGLFYAEKK